MILSFRCSYMFMLVVEDFGIKYVGRARLKSVLEKNYNVTTDWSSKC